MDPTNIVGMEPHHLIAGFVPRGIFKEGMFVIFYVCCIICSFG